MAGELGLALLAGILTTLSPCVLPVLPLILSGALAEHRWGPVAFALGLAAAFSIVGTAVLAVGFALGFDERVFRYTAATLLLIFGLVLLSHMLQARFAVAGGAVMDRANQMLMRLSPNGLGGQFVLGALVGMVWTPCVGPTLGAAMGLAARGEDLGRVFIIMVVFGFAAALPMLALAYGSRHAIQARREQMHRFAALAKPALGVLLLALALAVFTGLDKNAEAWLVALSPDWLTHLTTRF